MIRDLLRILNDHLRDVLISKCNIYTQSMMHFPDSAPIFSVLHADLLKLNGQTDLASYRCYTITTDTNTEEC